MDLQDQFNKLDLQKCLLIGLGLAVFYYLLMFDNGAAFDGQIQTAKTQMAQNETTLQTVRAALENQKKFEEEIKIITTNIKDFQKFFSNPMTENDLMASVSNYAELEGVVIEKLAQFKKDSEYREYPETAVQFIVEGSFHNIMSFVAQLTKMNRVIDFSKMQFTTTVPGDFPVVKLETVLVVYGYKEGAGEPATEGQDLDGDGVIDEPADGSGGSSG